MKGQIVTWLGRGYLLIFLSKQHTTDLNFISGNWRLQWDSWDAKDVFCGPRLAQAAKPLCNLEPLSVSDQPCSPTGQVWSSQGEGERSRAAQCLDSEDYLPLLFLPPVSSFHT